MTRHADAMQNIAGPSLLNIKKQSRESVDILPQSTTERRDSVSIDCERSNFSSSRGIIGRFPEKTITLLRGNRHTHSREGESYDKTRHESRSYIPRRSETRSAFGRMQE